MTIALHSRTSWREVEPDFTVGQTDGEYAGTIEHVDGRYVATSRLGVKLGSFDSVDAAQAAIESNAGDASAWSAPSLNGQMLAIAAGLALACTWALAAVISL